MCLNLWTYWNGDTALPRLSIRKVVWLPTSCPRTVVELSIWSIKSDAGILAHIYINLLNPSEISDQLLNSVEAETIWFLPQQVHALVKSVILKVSEFRRD
jgi:hypothetical protein